MRKILLIFRVIDVRTDVKVDYSDIKLDIKADIKSTIRTLHTVSYSIHTQTTAFKNRRFFLSVFLSELANTVKCKYFAHKNAI